MRVPTIIISLLLIIIWNMNVWAAEEKKKVIEKNIWMQTLENKAGLGIIVSNLDKDASGAMKEGAKIMEVLKGSEAEKIGLKKGDIIIEMDGNTIKKPSDLVDLFEDVEEGSDIKLIIFRDGQKKSFTAKLKPLEGHPYAYRLEDEDGDVLIDVFRTPGNEKDFRMFPPSGINASANGKGGYLGVQVKDLSDQLQDYFEVKNGVLVEEVMKDSPADKSGIKAGDIIVSINDRILEDYQDLIRTVNYYNPEEEVVISYVRKGDHMKTKVVLGKKPVYQKMGGHMKDPDSFQILNENGGNKIFITDKDLRKTLRVHDADSDVRIETEQEIFIL